jgi:hypothetical protein
MSCKQKTCNQGGLIQESVFSRSSSRRITKASAFQAFVAQGRHWLFCGLSFKIVGLLLERVICFVNKSQRWNDLGRKGNRRYLNGIFTGSNGISIFCSHHEEVEMDLSGHRYCIFERMIMVTQIKIRYNCSRLYFSVWEYMGPTVARFSPIVRIMKTVEVMRRPAVMDTVQNRLE